MIVSIQIRNENKKKIELKANSTALELLKKINLTPDEVIVIRKNSPIPVDEILNDKDEIKIIKVASGG